MNLLSIKIDSNLISNSTTDLLSPNCDTACPVPLKYYCSLKSGVSKSKILKILKFKLDIKGLLKF